MNSSSSWKHSRKEKGGWSNFPVCYWQHSLEFFSSRIIILWNSSSNMGMAIWDCCCGPVVKNPPPITGDTWDMDSIPGSERSPGWGNGFAPQYTCLEKSMDRKAWWATVHGVTEQLSTNHKQSYDFSTYRGWLPGKCHLSYVNVWV